MCCRGLSAGRVICLSFVTVFDVGYVLHPKRRIVSSIHLALLLSGLISYFFWTQEGAVNPHVLLYNLLCENTERMWMSTCPLGEVVFFLGGVLLLFAVGLDPITGLFQQSIAWSSSSLTSQQMKRLLVLEEAWG